MQIITNTFLKKVIKSANASTNSEDPSIPISKSYFDALQSLVDNFDLVCVHENSTVLGEFSISSHTAMITDGAVTYSLDGIDPTTHVEYAIAHVTGANYLITIDAAEGYRNSDIRISYGQLFVSTEKYATTHANELIGNLHNLEDAWMKEG